jgi:hypothetical protein
MKKLVRAFFFKGSKITTFRIIRLAEDEVQEKVFIKKGDCQQDISRQHGMICLDPFCLAAWLPADQLHSFECDDAQILFKKGDKLNAIIKVSLIEKIATGNGWLLLYRVKQVKNYQLSFLHRLVFLGWLIRSKKNTFYSRKVINALYSYPRDIIIVSYQDADYCNIFPMDIHGYIAEEGVYILGLRTTNVALNKILEAKKVVVCDTDTVDIGTVYALGKHASSSPTPKDQLPFGTADSELFGFPVPDFTGSYKEIEVIQHRKMGYHMLIIGKVVNSKSIKPKTSSFYHVAFLQFETGTYKSIEGVY